MPPGSEGQVTRHQPLVEYSGGPHGDPLGGRLDCLLMNSTAVAKRMGRAQRIFRIGTSAAQGAGARREFGAAGHRWNVVVAEGGFEPPTKGL